ncbi:MAG: MarR family winged helix-turn-helix transcriptional regulator [Pseudomonadota bacterium]
MPSARRNVKRDIHLMVDRDELLLDGTDEKFRQFIFDTIAFSARMNNVIENHAKIVELSPPQYLVLTSIMHLSATQDVNVKTIAGHLHISGSFVTTSVGALVRKGLVDKVVDKTDRRRVRLKETPAARKLISRLANVQNQVNNIMFESLTGKELDVLSRIVARLLPSAERAVMLQNHLVAEALAARGA